MGLANAVLKAGSGPRYTMVEMKVQKPTKCQTMTPRRKPEPPQTIWVRTLGPPCSNCPVEGPPSSKVDMERGSRVTTRDKVGRNLSPSRCGRVCAGARAHGGGNVAAHRLSTAKFSRVRAPDSRRPVLTVTAAQWPRGAQAAATFGHRCGGRRACPAPGRASAPVARTSSEPSTSAAGLRYGRRKPARSPPC